MLIILHILYILKVPRCTRTRRGQDWSLVPAFHQVHYRQLLDCHLTKYFMELSVGRSYIGTTLAGDNIGPEMIKVLTIRQMMSAS